MQGNVSQDYLVVLYLLNKILKFQKITSVKTQIQDCKFKIFYLEPDTGIR